MAVSESDLDYLNKWLSSDESPPNSMMLSDLDGCEIVSNLDPTPNERTPLIMPGYRPFQGGPGLHGDGGATRGGTAGAANARP